MTESYNSYNIGDLVRISGAFATAAGVAIDPTTATLRVKDPAGNVTVYTGDQLTHDGVGAFHLDFSPTVAGKHAYRWEGTGAAQAVTETYFFVRQSSVI